MGQRGGFLSCSMEVAFGWRWSGRDGLWDTKKCFLFPLGPYTVVLRFSREAPYIKAKWHFQWLSQVSYSKMILSKIVTWQVYKRRKTKFTSFSIIHTLHRKTCWAYLDFISKHVMAIVIAWTQSGSVQKSCCSTILLGSKLTCFLCCNVSADTIWNH